MASLGILVGVILLTLLVLVSWRARARTAQYARRLEAEAERGRELEGIATDAASLLAATLQSLDSARDVAESEGQRQPALEDAARAAGALSGLFAAARLYLQPENDAAMKGSAEGCVRVAVAVARSRGCGISVRGEHTDLVLRGPSRPACELVLGVLEACRASLEPGEFVELHLEDDGVRVLGGSGALALPELRAAELGWSVEPLSADGHRGVSIRERAPDSEEDGASGSAVWSAMSTGGPDRKYGGAS